MSGSNGRLRACRNPTSRSLKTLITASTTHRRRRRRPCANGRSAPGWPARSRRTRAARPAAGGRRRATSPRAGSAPSARARTSAVDNPVSTAERILGRRRGGRALNRRHRPSVQGHRTFRRGNEGDAVPVHVGGAEVAHAGGGTGVLARSSRAWARSARPRCRRRPAGRGGPDASVRRQPGDREPGLRRARAAEPVRRDAGAVPGRRVPRPGQVRLPQRGAWSRTGPDELCGRTVFCLHPAPDGLRGARRRGDGGAARRAGGPRRARRHRGDGRQRTVGRPAAARRPRGRRRCRPARLLRRPAPGAGARRLGDARRRRARRAAVAAALGVEFASPEEAEGGCDLVFHTSATASRAAAEPRAAGAGGHGGRAQLVRRQVDDTLPRWQLPLRSAEPQGEPGGHGGAGPPRSVARRRNGSPWRSSSSATTPSTACSPASRRSRRCPR